MNLLLLLTLCTPQADPFRAYMRDLNAQPKSAITLGKLTSAMVSASDQGAPAMTRFRFAAMTVVATDKQSLQKNEVKRFAEAARARLSGQELKLSPSYCYVFARLGLIIGKTRDPEVEAARRYYESRRDGISSHLYALVLTHHPSASVRAQSLLYALEAQRSQPDSLDNRWLVAGGYFEKADFTKEKTYWQAAIEAYGKALEIAKEPNDISMIKHYIELSKSGLAKSKG